ASNHGLDMTKRKTGNGSSLRDDGSYYFGKDAAGNQGKFDVAEKNAGWPPWLYGKVNEVRAPGAPTGSAYPAIIKALQDAHADKVQVGAYLKAAFQNAPLPPLPA